MQAIWLKSRDNARTPMQWDETEHAGFTQGQPPRIQVNNNYPRLMWLMPKVIRNPFYIFTVN